MVVLSVDEYDRLAAGQQRDDWKDLVRQARDEILADLGDRELPPSEEILQQIRESRDEQLLALR